MRSRIPNITAYWITAPIDDVHRYAMSSGGSPPARLPAYAIAVSASTNTSQAMSRQGAG
jgi:hypothetical protein